jgi:hypothetical protein
MQQVAEWLEKLDLGQYAKRFAENDIDASVLPHLTDQSLKELGVSLGHRLKILAAIKEFSPSGVLWSGIVWQIAFGGHSRRR